VGKEKIGVERQGCFVGGAIHRVRKAFGNFLPLLGGGWEGVSEKTEKKKRRSNNEYRIQKFEV
jgi:hypothetical protein